MDEYTKDLYTMMFSLQTLQNQGITIRETVYKSLDKLLSLNKSSCLKKPVFMRVSAISISLLITN